MAILAITLDSREPEWVKKLTFGGAAVAVDTLVTGDAILWLDDGQMLIVERKTSADFLLSIRDGRLFSQAARMVEERVFAQLNGKPINTWPYIIITGALRPSGKGLAIIDTGETGWNWESINGAFLTLQEMGVFLAFARDDADYERAILALGSHSRSDVQIYPARSTQLVSQQAAFLMGIPGIGEKHSAQILAWSGGNLAHAIVGLVDPQLKTPVGKSLQKSIRRFLGLTDDTTIDLIGI